MSLDVEPAALQLRVAPALVTLALQREISWSEAAFVLDAVEHFDRDREDLVELVAHHRFRFYRLIGGTERTLASYRAEVRHHLATGEEL
jgi:hypothetical protein